VLSFARKRVSMEPATRVRSLMGRKAGRTPPSRIQLLAQ
jgi:hypothetical protein